jgi:site-specific DNA recombinase
MARRKRKAPTGDAGGRVVLYVRVSELMGRGGETFHSPEIQITEMRQAATRSGLKEVAVVDDIDVSGQTFSRRGIDQIRTMVEHGQVDVVAVHDLSRLGRNLAESLTFIRWLRDRDVAIMSAQERIDDSPEGQYMIGQWLALAELVGAQIGRKWAQVIRRLAENGQHHGVLPTGYHRVDGALEVHPVMGPAITRAFADYAGNRPMGAILDDLAAANGRRLWRSSVKTMLRRRVYLGRVQLDSKLGGMVDAPGRHQPLTDQETWDLVQARLDRDAKLPPGWYPRRSP